MSTTLITKTACLALALVLAQQSAHAAVWNGAVDRNWDFTTANWSGSLFSNGQVASFNSGVAGSPGSVIITPTSVSPQYVEFFTSTGASSWTISGGDITDWAGPTSIRQRFDVHPIFTRDASYSFSGGTFVNHGGTTNNGRITYQPAGGGTYSFGTGPITLESSNSRFYFSPGTPGAVLTNNFVVNNGVWTQTAASNGTLTGTVTLQGTLNMENTSTVITEKLALGSNSTISTATGGTVKSAVLDGSGIHDLTLRIRGVVVDDHMNLDGPGGWNVRNIIRTSSHADKKGTLRIAASVDEKTFFSGMTGSLILEDGALRFMRSSAVDVNFSLVVNKGTAPFGTGFIGNTAINVLDGGTLGGDGIYRRKPSESNSNFATDGTEAMQVNVFEGGTLNPGNSAGMMTLSGGLNFVTGGLLNIELNGGGALAGVDYDQLKVLGSVDNLQNADLVIDVDPALLIDDLTGDTLTILTSGNDLTGANFNSITLLNAPFNRYQINYGDGFVTLSNLEFRVPEPGTLVLLMLALPAVALRRRRVR